MTREQSIHCARVYLAEARRRRGQSFAVTLLRWAANSRRRASQEPRQAELFPEAIVRANYAEQARREAA